MVTQQPNNAMNKAVWIFLVGLVLGIVLAASFTYAFRPFLDNVLYILIVLAFFTIILRRVYLRFYFGNDLYLWRHTTDGFYARDCRDRMGYLQIYQTFNLENRELELE